MVSVLQTDLEEHEAWTKAGPVVSRLPDDQIENLEAQTMATVADPVPMGLWAFATGTWIAGTVFGGALSTATFPQVAPILIIFGGFAQFIAGLFAYRRANALAVTSFCCIGSLYTALGFIFLLAAGALVGTTAPDQLVIGFLIESFCFIALALTLAAIETNWAAVAMFGLLAIGYGCAGIPYLVNSVNAGGWGTVGNIGGWFMCASAFCAAYTGLALIINTTRERAIMPIWGRP